MYFEGAKKQACNYVEDVLCYRCFSRNSVKIYKTAILMNFFQFMQSKSQWSTHLVVFYNPLMLAVTKGHKYLNKPGSLSICDLLLPPGVERLKCSGNF